MLDSFMNNIEGFITMLVVIVMVIMSAYGIKNILIAFDTEMDEVSRLRSRHRAWLLGVGIFIGCVALIGMLQIRPVDPGPSVEEDGTYKQNQSAPQEIPLPELKKDAVKRKDPLLRKMDKPTSEVDKEVKRILKEANRRKKQK